MGYVFLLAATAAVLFWVQRRFRRRPAATQYVYEPVSMSRPRFKDFRYSGGTYEESQANYQNAFRQWQEQTGNTADADE